MFFVLTFHNIERITVASLTEFIQKMIFLVITEIFACAVAKSELPRKQRKHLTPFFLRNVPVNKRPHNDHSNPNKK